MSSRHSRKFILEAIAYWKKQLRELNEASYPNKGPYFTEQRPGQLKDLVASSDLDGQLWRHPHRRKFPYFDISSKYSLQLIADGTAVALKTSSGKTLGFTPKTDSHAWSVKDAVIWFEKHGYLTNMPLSENEPEDPDDEAVITATYDENNDNLDDPWYDEDYECDQL